MSQQTSRLIPTIEGQRFIVANNEPAGAAGEEGHIQILNPTGSGVVVALTRLRIMGTVSSATFQLRENGGTALSNNDTNEITVLNRAVTTAGLNTTVHSEANATPQGNLLLDNLVGNSSAGNRRIELFTETFPMVLDQGQDIMVVNQTAAEAFSIIAFGFELNRALFKFGN